MTQWKRGFTDRSSKDTNNTRCRTWDGKREQRRPERERERKGEERRMWKEKMWNSRAG